MTYNLPGALLVPSSDNVKTGPITVTYLSQTTCPISCPLRDNGCYAETGLVGIYTRRLEGISRITAAMNEVELIRRYAKDIKAGDHKNPPRLMRLHVVGDVVSNQVMRKLEYAIGLWMEAIGLDRNPQCFSYTHNWRKLYRPEGFHLLASCENEWEASFALSKGWTPALVVPEHKGKVKYQSGSLSILPCPAQTVEGVTCSQCKLCAGKKDYAIAFAAHGSRKGSVLKVIA